MKKLFFFFLLLVLWSSCGVKMTQELTESTVVYQALSRGYYLNVEIHGDKLTISHERESAGKEYVLNTQDYKDISNLYQKVILKELENYNGPTEKRFYDGAAIANLSVNYKGEIYNSKSFDHGNPPVEIEAFINKIVAFTENK